MIVEITKAQKDVLTRNIELCVEFLKREVQPHFSSKDKVSVSIGENLELYITNTELYVKETKVVNILIDFYSTRILYLEKQDRKNAKKHICEACPEAALEFLKNWEDAKIKLLKEVDDKLRKVYEFDKFMNDFKL